MHIDHRHEDVADDDGIGNTLCGAAEETEQSGQDTKHNREDDLAERGDHSPSP